MLEVNCKDCRYRWWLLQYGGPYVNANNCDKYGQELCKKMNDPDFVEWMKTKGADHGTE